MRLIGIDTGGTFTDFVFVDRGTLHTWKRPSTPDDFSRGILDGVTHLTGEASRDVALVHASTVATNALLERKGATTGLLVTHGFRDLLLIGRQNRPDLYTLTVDRPDPLVPRSWCRTVRERVGADGAVITPLVTADVERAAAAFQRQGVTSVAVCFLFSFLRPAHERAAAAILRKAGLQVSCSSDILPEFREVERASTTVINAYVAPVMSAYLGRWTRSARRSGADSLRRVQSNGGSLSARAAGKLAVNTLLSGPAAGVAGAVFAAREALNTALPRLITFDMGGTSTDVALVDGVPATTTEGHIGSLPVGVPMMDIHTVGAGGGSLATVDAGGLLQVGPHSAGAMPGPACYGRSDRPTVTDANLLLGRLDPERFLGGRMPLDQLRAERAVREPARALGLDLNETAAAMVRVVNAHMERAIRVISVERGHDPSDFTLVSFGGAGGLHACALADALRIPRVLVPRHPGVLSALGCVAEDALRDVSRTVMLPDDAMTPARLAEWLRPLRSRASRALADEGFAPSDIRLEPRADLRYAGQSYELTVPCGEQPEEAVAAFHQAHRQRYGHAAPDAPVEWVTLRVRATGPVPKPALPAIPRGGPTPPRAAFAASGGSVPTLLRDALRGGNRFRGPAIVAEDFATLWLPEGWTCRVDLHGHLLAEAAA